MTDKFNGFSEDEINRVSGAKHNKKSTIKQPMEAKRAATYRGHGGITRVPDKSEQIRSKKMQEKNNFTANNKVLAEKIKSLESNDAMEEINLDATMSKSIEEALFYQPLKIRQKQISTTTIPANSETSTKTTIAKMSAASGNTQTNSQTKTSVPDSNDSSILKLNSEDESRISSSSVNSMDHDDSSILPTPPSSLASPSSSGKMPTHYAQPSSLYVESPFRGISLKDFESHRKMIEEQNRQKKDLLYKAIEQHSQKTAAETRKIEEIKAELSKLDNDLAVDVAVLRKQIEIACVHFANVEKQYMKIESQFLKAKMDLHNAAEKKELLTEHLCTVIAHNEDRKAQKLSELMEKVGLASKNGDYEAPSSTSN